ncbi:L,D-transpeptidase family protein [Vineibacter terrae]|uniref:L,D-transpeptidase family protein n=1 Tax=Vineibacter terrae TaxID=2586908 RepID=UPI002E34E2BE|nr:L,D-transpeptidase family protein [Vineibacter terrae]HEX2892009.1 L,D-transpeptidase family protein [Vineibacter terrae]
MTVFLVAADAADATRGRIAIPGAGDRACALGRGGARIDKREGDGATPIGAWGLRRVWYRADRLNAPPATVLPLRAIVASDGWCDDASSPDYNRPVTLPHPARHERMWRDDAVYDVVVELGYNDDPPISGRGSAIFLHVARPDFTPTEGCVALARDDLLALLRACDGNDALHVTASSVGPRRSQRRSLS